MGLALSQSQRSVSVYTAADLKPLGLGLLGRMARTPCWLGGIGVIHQLAGGGDTLWLRLLGRGRVQQEAMPKGC